MRTIVVGGGASGLAAAFHLHRAGHEVELVEREATLGGRFGVGRLGDKPVMTGGKNVGRAYTGFRDFVAALGADSFVPFGYNASRVKDGKVLTLDSSKRLSTLLSVARMGSPRDVLRLLGLARRIRSDRSLGYLGSAAFREVAREHDHAPLTAHFGAKITRYLLRPMVIRNNGAEPDEVYYGTFGTNLAMLLDTYDQLADGIEPVLDAFAELVPVHLGTEAESVVVRGGAVAGLVVRRGGRVEELPCEGLVLATPAHAAAAVLDDDLPALAGRLRDVRYFPSTVVLVEYDRDFFTEQVRALAMDGGPCTNAGSYGMDERHIVRYTFSGRHGRLDVEDPVVITRWVDDAEREVAGLLGITPGSRVRTLTRHWPAAYSGYVPHHGDFLDEVAALTAELPGLALAGDYLRGVSIEGCFRSGVEAARALAGAPVPR